ncbi:hypothetical protein F5Y15DRAFT_419641 [Xylariaceae sp. FL0016]|nr:hypothetical protein F5Y15DRAFT_419641 [Xylariaceae sp. FL0016]
MAFDFLDPELNPLSEQDVPPQLQDYLSHPLTVVDQAAERGYRRRMFIFDFEDTSDVRLEVANAYIRLGLEAAVARFPFLTGRLGPLRHPSRPGLVQVRYGRTPEARDITWDIYRSRFHAQPDDNPLKMEEWCAAPKCFRLRDWPPVFTLQANFIENCALVLCFAIQKTAADETAFHKLIETIAAGIHGDIEPGNVITYVAPDLGRVTTEHFGYKRVENFPEWTIENKKESLIELEHGLALDRGPETRLFTIPAKKLETLRKEILEEFEDSGLSASWCPSEIDCLAGLLWVLVARSRYCLLQHKEYEERQRLSDISTATHLQEMAYIARDETDNEYVRDRMRATKKQARLMIEANLPKINEVPKNIEYLRCSTTLDVRDRLEPRLELFENMSLESVSETETHDLVVFDNFGDPLQTDSHQFFLAAALIAHEKFDMTTKHVQGHIMHLSDSSLFPDLSKMPTIEAQAARPKSQGVRFESLADFGANIDFGIPGAGFDGDGRPR